MKKTTAARGTAFHTKRIVNRYKGDYNARIEFGLRKSAIANLAHMEPFVRHFVHYRDLWHYDTFFSAGLRKMGLGNDIADAVSRIPRGRKKPLDVLEDGPGSGIFLGEFKEYLKEKGIDTHTTGVDFHYADTLKQMQKYGKIDKVVHGIAEFFTPEKRYHAIFSMMGSVHYTINAFRKDQLLKFASALRKGGIMMVGFQIGNAKEPGAFLRMDITDGLSPKPKENRRMPIEKEMEGIEKAFVKRGYAAKFLKFDEKIGARYNLPNWMLIVKRLR